MRNTLIVLALLPLAACTFVKMAPGGAEVRVVAADRDMSACQARGEVEVSVKDRLGPYERDALRVSDELETLARNEAPDLAADTVQPKGPPVDGGQRFLAWRCGAAAPIAPRQAVETQAPEDAVTTPLKD